jgi:hypothetical protein
MTEGGIAAWKKQEGESFSAGDVLLEIVSPPSPRALALSLMLALEYIGCHTRC